MLPLAPHIPTLARAIVLTLLFLFMTASVAHGQSVSDDACLRISEAGKITKTQALVIAYEGLFSSSAMNANLLSEYREALATGKPASRPAYLFGLSFLVRGPLTRLVEQYKNQVQVFDYAYSGHTSASSVPATCAKLWMSDKGPGAEGRRVAIVGHSFGGGAAWELADTLNKQGTPVDCVITADARAPSMCMGECWHGRPKPANVKQWANFYQRGALKGNIIPGATNSYQGGFSHGNIQNSPALYEALSRCVSGMEGPLTTDSPLVADKGNGPSGALDRSVLSGISESDRNPPPLPPGFGSSPQLMEKAEREAARVAAKEAPGTNTSQVSATANGNTDLKADAVAGARKRNLTSASAMKPKSKPAASAVTGQGTPKPVVMSSPTAAPASAAQSSATQMLSGLWTLSKGETKAPPTPGEKGYHLGSGSGASASSSTETETDPSLAGLKTENPSLNLAEGNNLDSFAGAATGLAESNAADLARIDLSLFIRVRNKHLESMKNGNLSGPAASATP